MYCLNKQMRIYINVNDVMSYLKADGIVTEMKKEFYTLTNVSFYRVFNIFRKTLFENKNNQVNKLNKLIILYTTVIKL